jgi:hypothetical protein
VPAALVNSKSTIERSVDSCCPFPPDEPLNSQALPAANGSLAPSTGMTQGLAGHEGAVTQTSSPFSSGQLLDMAEKTSTALSSPVAAQGSHHQSSFTASVAPAPSTVNTPAAPSERVLPATVVGVVTAPFVVPDETSAARVQGEAECFFFDS